MGILGNLKDYLKGDQGQSGAEKRQYDRKTCNQVGNFIDHEGHQRECTIINMSLGGLLISTPWRLKAKEVIGFVSPSFEAKVIWTKKNVAGRQLAGLSFVQAIQ